MVCRWSSKVYRAVGAHSVLVGDSSSGRRNAKCALAPLALYRLHQDLNDSPVIGTSATSSPTDGRLVSRVLWPAGFMKRRSGNMQKSDLELLCVEVCAVALHHHRPVPHLREHGTHVFTHQPDQEDLY